MSKRKILLIFQNAYSRNKRNLRLRNPIYSVDVINRKNATYSRVVPYLEPHFELFFAECTPILATNNKDKFVTDLNWVKRALDHTKWDVVIAFGAQAHQAIDDLDFNSAEKLPHPVSFKWRKQLMIDVVEKITPKEILTN